MLKHQFSKSGERIKRINVRSLRFIDNTVNIMTKVTAGSFRNRPMTFQTRQEICRKSLRIRGNLMSVLGLCRDVLRPRPIFSNISGRIHTHLMNIFLDAVPLLMGSFF